MHLKCLGNLFSRLFLVILVTNNFWFKSIFVQLSFFLSDTFTCPILGPLVHLFWISGDILWVSKPDWVLTYSHSRGECNVHSLRSASGVTCYQPLDRHHRGASTRFISCPRILLAPVRLKPAIIAIIAVPELWVTGII